jgi:hypothetical protein
MTRTVIRHAVGDIVRLPTDKAKGTIDAQLAGNFVVVKWPDHRYTKHHARELISVVKGEP